MRSVRVRRHHKRGALLRALFRLLFGMDLSGTPRTNAGFLARGDKVYHRSGRASRWAHLPHSHRAGVRLAVLALALYASLGLWLDPAGTRPTLVVLFWLTVLVGGWLTIHNARRQDRVKRYLLPAAAAVGELLNISRHVDPRSWILVPEGHREDPAKPVEIKLPDNFHGAKSLQDRIVEVAGARLGMPDPEPEWKVAGKDPVLLLRATPLPPLTCTFATLSPLLDAAAPGERVLGKGTRDSTISAALGGDAPHICISAETGAGKSYTTGLIAMQVLHDGGNALILDIKLASIPWARTLSSVRYCDSIRDIHNALVWLNGEMERRYQALKATINDEGETDDDAVGPELLVVLEEVNSLVAELEGYWNSVREKEDPKTSPAVSAIRRGLAMGRQARIRFLVIAQYLTAQAIGGPAARQNLPTKILIRPNRNTWNMLAPECKQPGGRYPDYGTNNGRAVIIMRGKASAIQLAFVTNREAKIYATSGIVTPFPGEVPGSSAGSASTPTGASPSNVILLPPPEDRPSATRVDSTRLVTLREAFDAGMFPDKSWEAVKKARTNARKQDAKNRFPEPEKIVGQKEFYDPAALVDFYESRKEFTS